MQSSIARFIPFICLIGFVILMNIIPILTAATGSFYWEKIDFDLELVESGDLLVTETQKYIFTDINTNPLNHYIEINPLHHYIEIDQSTKTWGIAVTENNQPVTNLQISDSYSPRHLKWEIPLVRKFPEAHTFVLKYKVVGGLAVADSQTKFKWMAILPNRQAPIKAAQVTLHLPAKLVGTAKNFTTTGVAVDTKIINPTTIQFVVKEPIEAQSKLAVIGQFPTNLLPPSKSQPPSLLANIFGWIVFLLVIILWLNNPGNSSEY